MPALLITSLALGLDNFAVAIAIGLSGVRRATRWRVGVIFGLFEAGMPVLGLALGHVIAARLGSATHWGGAGLLIATGGYGVFQALRPAQDAAADSDRSWGIWRVLATGAALSLDNLAVGFALGTNHVDIAAAAIAFGVTSVAMSLAGLELGGKLGPAAGQRGELLGGVVLIGVGAALAGGLL